MFVYGLEGEAALGHFDQRDGMGCSIASGRPHLKEKGGLIGADVDKLVLETGSQKVG